jgi:hypothetical protein
MPRMSADVRSITNRAFIATLIALSVEIGIGIAIWPSQQWHALVVAVAVTTYLFAALFGTLLAGEKWPAFGESLQSHSWIAVGCIMGTAGAIIGYVAYPDPASLILGPLVLGVFVLMGWGIQKLHLFGF